MPDIYMTVEEIAEAEQIKLLMFQQNYKTYLDLLRQAADGELTHSVLNENAVEHALNEVEAFLKRALGVGERNFPDRFWEDAETYEIAWIISRAQAWLFGDDLIDFPEAAILLRGEDTGVTRATYSRDTAARVFMNSKIRPNKEGAPQLTLYMMPGARFARRVRRSEVLAMRDKLSR